jgi:hypothetical protein
MTTSSETWESVGTTLLQSMHLLAVLDDPEGFRILVQDGKQPWFVYGVFGEAVYYQRNRALRDCSYAESPAKIDQTQTMLYLIHESRLIERLRKQEDIDSMGAFDLRHYALCLRHEERIDIVSNGPLLVRLAGNSSWGTRGTSVA